MPQSLVSSEILEIFRHFGNQSYGEQCTVNAHSVQSGLIAKEKGYDEELILAAFLHDIGHLCPLALKDTPIQKMGDYGLEAHDKWGADYLRSKGFSDRIIATVKNHVDSKRYLCFAEPGYYEQLSEASKQTLSYQGGPMHADEAKNFQEDLYFEDSIRIRRIDEAAKAENFVVDQDHWLYFEQLLNTFFHN